MTNKEAIYLDNIKKMEDSLRLAELDYKVLQRTLFLEHEEPKERTLINSQRMNEQKNRLVSDLLVLCEELTKVKF